MKRELTITTNTEALSRLRFQNDCLTNYLNKLPPKKRFVSVLNISIIVFPKSQISSIKKLMIMKIT